MTILNCEFSFSKDPEQIPIRLQMHVLKERAVGVSSPKTAPCCVTAREVVSGRAVYKGTVRLFLALHDNNRIWNCTWRCEAVS